MLQWAGGWINTNGQTLINAGTGFITIANPSGTNAYLIGGGTLVNQGTIDETGTAWLYFRSEPWTVDTTLDNQAGATFAFQGDGGITSDTWGGTFSNEAPSPRPAAAAR